MGRGILGSYGADSNTDPALGLTIASTSFFDHLANQLDSLADNPALPHNALGVDLAMITNNCFACLAIGAVATRLAA